ncbi:LCP family protein [Clostridium sp. MD294]|uniref:LCP family protein n=1 Tax=Clostridium sp. MD294 TaxID=97138 RepID=UPI0002CC34F0|nr:LCP family protein [Clostridium sp. MD294]NDO46727.1 LytR family transcriptional regulator [Clostridium sp. MD294]USF28832.1 Polyisoprenyl-teichoic acid--peptidoglycan teichoic acid transferase TagU [Clostridium sp. MD294]
MSKEEEQKRRQQYYRQMPQMDKNRQQMDRQLSQMNYRQSVHTNKARQPQQMGMNRQSQRMGMNRQPQQMGMNRQSQQMNIDRQPQQIGSNKQSAQLGRRTQRKQNQHRLRKIFIRTFLIVFFVLFLGTGGVFAAFKYYTKDLKRETIDETVLQVNEEKKIQSVEMKIKNIAVFGVDSRNGEDAGNSDAIMIVSIDGNKGKIKMVSIARDTYVNLPNYGKTKITHAYSYGGPELAIATLNENFGMDITDYVTVNFEQLAEIIEHMGGIDVELNEAERQELNKYVAPGVEKIQQTGAVHLNGEQAVSYSRIRKCDSDDMRTSRQRKVMMCLFEKLKEISPFQYPFYVKILMPMMETSMIDSEILQLAPVAMNKNLVLEQDSFPNDYIQTDGYKTKTEVEGVELWVYHYDLQEATNMLQKFIYDDIPFDQQ